mmetsp:Transcript_11761/g.33795  ORF Transcript_11761/g.33795 Transcript_11761/m.33795 type:complete len:80 (+) Transcript_11761:1743-1982(+)
MIQKYNNYQITRLCTFLQTIVDCRAVYGSSNNMRLVTVPAVGVCGIRLDPEQQEVSSSTSSRWQQFDIRENQSMNGTNI